MKLSILAPKIKMEGIGLNWTRSDMPGQVGGKILARAYRDSIIAILYQDFSGCFLEAPSALDSKYDQLITGCRGALMAKFTDDQLMTLAHDV